MFDFELTTVAWISTDQFFVYASDQIPEVVDDNREAVSLLVNAACDHIQNYLRMPVITQHFQEYYYGNSQQRIFTRYSPLVVTTSRPLAVYVRSTGSSVIASTADGWATYTRNTDFVADESRGLLTALNAWPDGFRNIYIDYYAGMGDQIFDAQNQVVDSTVPPAVKYAAFKLVEYWYRNDIAKIGENFLEAMNGPSGRQMPLSMPPVVAELLQSALNKRPIRFQIY